MTTYKKGDKVKFYNKHYQKEPMIGEIEYIYESSSIKIVEIIVGEMTHHVELTDIIKKL